MRQIVFAFSLLGTLGVTSLPVSAEVKIEEKVVGAANAGGVYAVSPRGAHIAYAATKGSRLVVTIDGVEGPVFDELFTPTGQSFYSPAQISTVTASSGGSAFSSITPVIYSADGAHYAYAGRQGNEYVVIHDGKEIARGPRPMLTLNYGALTISPQGKYVFWDEMQMQPGGRGSWRLVINGKPGPWSGHQTITPVFSSDDSRYAYTAVSLDDKDKHLLIVDGKAAGYTGHSPMFTADSKILLTIAPGNVVLVDGKPAPVSGISIEKVVTSPVGRRYAVIMRKRVVNYEGVGVLYLDGKEVPGTDGARSISFSPDGKRYALTCINPEARTSFMIIDGKKGNEYQGISDQVFWTPDSSKAIYQATSGGRNFVVVESQEFAVQTIHSLMRPPFVFPAKGNRYAFSSFDGMNRNFLVVIDGQQVLPAGLSPVGDSLTFSPDGSRYAYQVGPIGRSEITGLILDGKPVEGYVPYEFGKMAAMTVKTPASVFSPDGKHVAHMGRTADNGNVGVYVNGKLVHPTKRGVLFPAFTPDSQHVFWVASETFPDRPQPYFVVYVDGESTVRLSEDPFIKTPGAWELGADGALTFSGVAGDVVKRYRISASSDMNIDKMITRAAETQAKAVADAAAAKKKADEDAIAAKAKAAADKADAAAKAKAESEAAAAKRKADYDAAVAARAKARQDAADAKAKARADAAAAKAKK